VLLKSNAPAALAKGLFMSHTLENSLLQDASTDPTFPPNRRQQIADELAKGSAPGPYASRARLYASSELRRSDAPRGVWKTQRPGSGNALRLRTRRIEVVANAIPQAAVADARDAGRAPLSREWRDGRQPCEPTPSHASS
jgi:hypothetical protein